MSCKEILINSFNSRGLRDKTKRQQIFHWLKTSYFGITFLQETHSIETDENTWKSEWGGKIFYSNGTSNSRGVAILIPDSLAIDIKIISECKDQTGRILVIDCKIEGLPLTLVNIYAPTRDRLAQQITFLAELRDILQNLASKNLIIG